MTKEELKALLYEAAGETVGIVITTENPQLLRQRLYSVLAETLDLPPMSLHISPIAPHNEVWVVKKEQPDGP